MVTDRYMEVGHRDDAGGLARDCAGRGVTLVGVDNVEGSVPIGTADLPEPACLVFGSEARGLSPEMVDACALVVHIPQRGSTRSMNVGHAAAIAMWEWVRTRPGEPGRTRWNGRNPAGSGLGHGTFTPGVARSMCGTIWGDSSVSRLGGSCAHRNP